MHNSPLEGNSYLQQLARRLQFTGSKVAVGLNNLYFEDIDLARDTLWTNSSIEVNTPFIPLNNFNDLVANVEFDWIETYEYNSPQDENSSIGTFLLAAQNLLLPNTYAVNDFNFGDYKVWLKLIVKMPIINPTDPQQRFTEQVLTFELDPEDDYLFYDSGVSGQMDIPWSLTSNPSGGSALILDAQSILETEWSPSHFNYWGGPSPQDIQVHASERISIIGEQTLSPEIATVEFIAGSEIVVFPGSELIGDFTLRIEDFVQMTSTATPEVTDTYLNGFCSGQVPNSYQANRPSTRIEQTITASSEEYKYDLSIPTTSALQISPNPSDSFLKLINMNQDILESIEIFNSQGQLMNVDGGEIRFGTTDILINVSSFSNGVYQIRGIHKSGDVSVKSFVVVH